jgi:hypothetical protein
MPEEVFTQAAKDRLKKTHDRHLDKILGKFGAIKYHDESSGELMLSLMPEFT